MKLVERLESLCNQGIDARLFPGAAFAVGSQSQWVSSYVGRTTYLREDSHEISGQSLFDLASLTKPLCTARLARIAVERGLVKLDSRSPYSDEVTLKQLLTHTSGLPPYFDFHLQEPRPRNVLELILAAKPDPGLLGTVVYSCLGFVWLQHWLETLFRESLDSLYRNMVAKPLKLDSSGFLPYTWDKVTGSMVPTVEIEPWRRDSADDFVANNGLLQGVVHDPIAYQLGGVSGNAGLFSNLNDVASLVRLDLIRAMAEGKDAVWTWEQAPGRSLGWAVWTLDCSAGKHFSSGSFGHTGYTGTSIWIDPRQDLFAILLTNRIHPDDTVNLLNFRRTFHEEIFGT